MKKILILSVLTIALISGTCKNSLDKNDPSEKEGTTQAFNFDTTKLKSGQTFYQCSMDPEVISDHPGQCPKCKMDLTERKKQ